MNRITWIELILGALIFIAYISIDGVADNAPPLDIYPQQEYNVFIR